MVPAKSFENMQDAAWDVVEDCTHVLWPFTSSITCPAEAKGTASDIISQPQYQTLLDFVVKQAARAGIKSQELLDEICLHYKLMDVRNMPETSFWDALGFIRHYVDGAL